MPFKLEIDPATADPITLGEFLREATFVDGYGCYTSFEVVKDAVRLPLKSAVQILAPGDPEYRDELFAHLQPEAYWFNRDGYMVAVAWVWDGDGTLVFEVWQKGDLIRRISNHDCKKYDRWTDKEED